MFFDGVLEQFGLRYHDYEEIIKEGNESRLSDLDFIYLELQNWLNSGKRKMQLTADRYYNYEPDKLEKHKVWGMDADGMPIVVDDELPPVTDNIYALQVDKKVNYVLGKAISYQAEDELYTKWLGQIIDQNFMSLLNNVTTDAYNSGISWVHPHFEGDGTLNFRMIPSLQVLPFWADDEHTKLDMAVRYYLRTVYEGRTQKLVQHVDVFTPKGINKFIIDGGKLIENPYEPFLSYGLDREGNEYSWGRIPLVAFKSNPREIPLLKRGKQLQDSINRVRAGWDFDMTSDVDDKILVCRNYGGENVGDLKRNIIRNKAVNVADNGGIEVLSLQRDVTNYVNYLSSTKKALIEALRGFDAKDDRMGNNPNEMNLLTMYSDIDLDADMLEVQYQYSLDQLLWFVDEYLKAAGAGDFTNVKVKFTFNRNMIVNEGDIINNVRNSQGIVSTETLLAHHPYVDDIQAELAKLEEEQLKQMEQMMAYQQIADNGGEGDEEQ